MDTGGLRVTEIPTYSSKPLGECQRGSRGGRFGRTSTRHSPAGRPRSASICNPIVALALGRKNSARSESGAMYQGRSQLPSLSIKPNFSRLLLDQLISVFET